MSTEEEAIPVDINMTTSERVRVHAFTHSQTYNWYYYYLFFPFQVVDLLNQAALISADEKLTVLKQVCSYFTNFNFGGVVKTK